MSDKLASKAQKITIKLPWEIVNMYSDVLTTDDEEDEDDLEAHEASIQRLKVIVSRYRPWLSWPDNILGSRRCYSRYDSSRISTLL